MFSALFSRPYPNRVRGQAVTEGERIERVDRRTDG